MPIKNLFSEPFDDGTLFKLKIFEDYFKEWLPVFVSSDKPFWKKIQIFDLFAGMGKDENGILGSPLRILNELNKWKTTITLHNLEISVVFNEFSQKNYEGLINNIANYQDNKTYKLQIFNDDFKVIFDRYYPSMKESANFLFLDQNGIKQITEEVFKKIIVLQQTDFIFFISSSFIKRFAEVDSFKKHLNITRQALDNKSYYHIHRIVLDYYRALVPNNKQYFLAPFSIKKPAGIYGLIFGTNHIYGLEKFLSVCWKHDTLTGEANFDIDNEKIDMAKPSLFEQFNVPKKIQVFEDNLRQRILSRILKSDLEVYTYTLQEGFLPKHANKVLKRLKEEKKVDFNFSLISHKVHTIKSASTIKVI